MLFFVTFCHLLSQIWSMNFHSLTTRGHPLTTWTLALHYCCTSPSDYNSHHPLHWRHTAVTNLTLLWLHSWSHNHTRFISLGLLLCHCRVLYSVYNLVVIVLPCLVCFLVFWFLPVFPGLTLCLALRTLFAPRLDYCSCTWIISLPCPVGYCSLIADLRLPWDYSLSCLIYIRLLLFDPACDLILLNKACTWIRTSHVLFAPLHLYWIHLPNLT